MSHVRISYETFQKTASGAQAALLAMGKSTEESDLDKTIVELAKLRVSQTNNCAFCLQINSTCRGGSAYRKRSST